VFRDHVKLSFFKGASLKDPGQLFNAGLEAMATRAIDFLEGEPIHAAGVKAPVNTARLLKAPKGE